MVTLDGRPERLLIQRDGDVPALALSARNVARVRSVERPSAWPFSICRASQGYSLRPDELPPVRGASIEVEIRTEARQDKLATVELIGPAEERASPAAGRARR